MTRVLSFRGLLLLSFAAFLAACETNNFPTDTTSEPGTQGPAFATSDGTVDGGNPDFFFLDPLAFTDPTQDEDFEEGEFNPNLPPFVDVCELTDDSNFETFEDFTEFLANTPGFEACRDGTDGPFVARFEPSDITVNTTDEEYQVNFKTDGLDDEKFYRIIVNFGTAEIAQLGWRDLDPVDSNPGVEAESTFDFYRFELGKNIPIKFRIENRVLCSGDAGDECAAAAVFDSDGGTVSTETGGIILDQFALDDGDADDDEEVVAVIVEEVVLAPGEDCLEIGTGSNAQAVGLQRTGPCFRIRTEPKLDQAFESPATVFVCVDVGLSEEQEDLYQVHRQDEDTGDVFSLPNVTVDCPEQTAVRDGGGLMDLARRGLDAVRRSVLFWADPPPLVAADQGLGGETGFTSRFQWALPAQMAIEEGNDPTQIVPVNTAVPIPPAVLVTDGDGNAVPGATVGFSAAGPQGGDAVDPALPDRVTTGSDGIAAVTSWTLGPDPGEYELEARGVGIADAASEDPFGDPTNQSTVQLQIRSLTFTAIACEPGFGSPNAIDGTMDEGEWECAESADFEANVSGGSGVPATVFWMNDGDSLYLALRVEESDDKLNQLGFDFDNDGDGTAEVGDDILLVDGANGEPGDFVDMFLTEKCLSKGQSLCGELDTEVGGSEDGLGAFDRTATATTYELSHPLASGDKQLDLDGDGVDDDIDFQRAGGEKLGFFLTLRLGKGAKGNTQWPDFRDYKIITIKSPPQ